MPKKNPVRDTPRPAEITSTSTSSETENPEIHGTAELTLPALQLNAEWPNVPADMGDPDPIPEPTKEEADEFSRAFDEAVTVLELKEKREAKQLEIERTEAMRPASIREAVQKRKLLADLHKELESLSSPTHTNPTRKNQKHQLKVREVAKKLWEKDPQRTIQDIIMSNEVKAATHPDTYADKTLRNWIKDLAPNRQPGRRKKG